MDPSQADPLAGKKSKAEKKRARAAEDAMDEAGFFGSDGGASDPDMKDFDEFEKLMDMGVGAEEDEEASGVCAWLRRVLVLVQL